MRKTVFAVAALAVAIGVPLVSSIHVSAQVAVLEKGKPTTLHGEIIEISCYKSKGAREGTGAAHLDCAKKCVSEGKAVGLLSDGDGLWALTGDWTKDRNAKLVPYLGQTVDVTGVRVFLSNSYDIRQTFEIQKITPVKKGN